MSVSDDKKFEILNDHYKDTFTHAISYRKQRDRLFLYLLLVLAIMFVQVSSPDNSTALISGLLSKKLGKSIALEASFIKLLVWFLLFSLVLKYYQLVVVIERQYAYLHKLEKELASYYLSQVAFTREGKSYLENYPKLSDWADRLYVWVFPTLFLFFISAKFVIEFLNEERFSFVLVISLVFCLMIWVTSVLYLHFRYKLKQAQKKAQENCESQSA